MTKLVINTMFERLGKRLIQKEYEKLKSRKDAVNSVILWKGMFLIYFIGFILLNILHHSCSTKWFPWWFNSPKNEITKIIIKLRNAIIKYFHSIITRLSVSEFINDKFHPNENIKKV